METIFLPSAVFKFFPFRTEDGGLVPAPALFLGGMGEYVRARMVLGGPGGSLPTYNITALAPTHEGSVRTRVEFSLSHLQGGGVHPKHKFVFVIEMDTTDLLLLNSLAVVTDDMEYVRVYDGEAPANQDTTLNDDVQPIFMLCFAPSWREEKAKHLTKFFAETGTGAFGRYSYQDFEKAHLKMTEAVQEVQESLFRAMYALTRKDPLSWMSRLEWLIGAPEEEEGEESKDAAARRNILMSLLTPNYLLTHPLRHTHEEDEEKAPSEKQAAVDDAFLDIMNYNDIFDESLTESAAERVSYPSMGHSDAVLNLADPLRFFIEDPEYSVVFNFLTETDPDALTVARWDVRRREVADRAVEEYGMPAFARALSLVLTFRALYRVKEIQPGSTLVGTLVTMLTVPGNPYPWELEAIISDLITYNSELPVDVIASMGVDEAVSPYGVVLLDELLLRLHREGWTASNLDARLQESAPRIQGIPKIRSLITLLLDVPDPAKATEGQKPDPTAFFGAIEDAFKMLGGVELYQVISHLIPIMAAAAWDEDDAEVDGKDRGEFIAGYVEGFMRGAASRVARTVASPAA